MLAETIEELEIKLVEVNDRLNQLAHLSFRNGVGPIGYRTLGYDTAEQEEWVRIDWGAELDFDQIILVPVVTWDSKQGYLTDGFPVEFSLWIGGGGGEREIARYSEQDRLLPRISPLVITASGRGSWLELRATKLSPRNYDGDYVLELAEILVFHGQENIALQAQVTTPKSAELSPPRQAMYLTDGQLPYSMVSGGDVSGTRAYMGVPESNQEVELMLDLEQSVPIDQIYLHAVETSDTIPQTEPDGFGIPRHFILEGAGEPDFSDAVPLWEYKKSSPYVVGTMLYRKLSGESYRHLRLRVLTPDFVDLRGLRRAGFSEIEILSEGRNVALGKVFTTNGIRNDVDCPASNLTDGRNYYGEILPIRQWLGQVAERENLESALPMLKARLRQKYEEYKLRISRQFWMISLALATIVILALMGYLYKNREITGIRERFAADLHDELGANLHAIGILGELAKEDINAPLKLQGTLEEIQRLTERTAATTRMCIDKQANPTAPDLALNMERITRRMMADLQWDLQVVGEEYLTNYRQQVMDDLYLFYKECLVNISRHSGASKLEAEILIAKKSINLSVRDNGKGVAQLPPSLARRAKLLRAIATCIDHQEGGTRIQLTYNRPLFPL